MKKNILLFSHEFPPYIGGVGSVGYQLAKWLSEAGHKVTVLTRKQPGLSRIRGVDFIEIDVIPKLWTMSYKKWLDTVDLLAYDSIILNECAPTIVAGKYFNEKELKLCTLYLHGLEVENIYKNSIYNLARQIFGFKKHHLRAVNRVKNVVAVGQHMKSKFKRELKSDLKRHVDVIYAGLYTDEFSVEKSNSDTFTLVSASRVIKEKGYFEKLAIFEKLLETINIKWIICGDGADKGLLEERAKEKGIDDRIEFMGYCSRDSLKTIYGEADFFWLLSNYDEALPLCYIEAQLCGLPAIGRNVGGTKETIIHGTNGYLVNNNTDCENIIKDYVVNDYRFEKEQVRNSALYFDINKNLVKLVNKL